MQNNLAINQTVTIAKGILPDRKILYETNFAQMAGGHHLHRLLGFARVEFCLHLLFCSQHRKANRFTLSDFFDESG